MTLKQAVKEVIRQNEQDAKFRPTKFIEITKNGEINDLDSVISRLVLDPRIQPKIIETLERYHGKPIFIEEFIAKYSFNFSKEVIGLSIDRTKIIQEIRIFYSRH
jgi:hypothetical protein